jgi:hypothetical protein
LVHGAVCAIDTEPKPVERRAEALAHKIDVARVETLHLANLPAAPGRCGEQGLNRLLVLVAELRPIGAEKLDAVVLGRVVGRRDDGAAGFCEQGDRGRREDAAEDYI